MLEQKLNEQIILKKQSVNKLVQVMTMKRNQPSDNDGKGQSRKMLKVTYIYVISLFFVKFEGHIFLIKFEGHIFFIKFEGHIFL